MAIQQYYLGCPLWSCKDWVGRLYRRDAKPSEFLQQYASVFNTVEGNTTFYAIPSAATVARWLTDTPANFRFCFKLPRRITHELRLRHVEAETETFFQRLTPLASRLGPVWIQLPPTFSPQELPILESYLDQLPTAWSYVVEVRHPAFYEEGPAEQHLNELLAKRGLDRAIFDTRALRAVPPIDEAVRHHQQRKPDLPTRFLALSERPFFRFVAHPQVEANRPYLAHLATVVAGWIADGCTPYIFMHSPYDVLTPQVARLFHQLMRERVDVGEMPRWPGEESAPPEQLSLFG